MAEPMRVDVVETLEPVCGRMIDLPYVIEVDDPAVADELRGTLHDSLHRSVRHVGAEEASPEQFRVATNGSVYELWWAGSVVHVASTIASVVEAVVWNLNRRSIEHRSVGTGSQVAVHAGAVALGSSGIALVGPSGGGKTTAAIGLARLGFGYLSDDIVLVGPKRELRGSRKPVGLRAGTRELLGLELTGGVPRSESSDSVLVAASRLGVDVIDRAEIEVMVFLAPHGDPGELRPLRRSLAVQRLVEACFVGVPLSQSGLVVLADAARGATTLEWTRGSLRDLSAALRAILAR